MTDNPSEMGNVASSEVADYALDDLFETMLDGTVYPPLRVEMQDLPANLREVIGHIDDCEGFRGWAFEIVNMPQDVEDGWLYIVDAARMGCLYVDRRYSERCTAGMDVEIGPAWFDVDTVEDAARLFLEILREGGWVHPADVRDRRPLAGAPGGGSANREPAEIMVGPDMDQYATRKGTLQVCSENVVRLDENRRK